MHVTIAALQGVTIWLAFLLFAGLSQEVGIGLVLASGPVVVSSSTLFILAVDLLLSKAMKAIRS